MFSQVFPLNLDVSFGEETPPARAVAAVQAEVAPDPPRPDWPTQGCQNPRPGIGKWWWAWDFGDFGDFGGRYNYS